MIAPGPNVQDSLSLRFTFRPTQDHCTHDGLMEAMPTAYGCMPTVRQGHPALPSSTPAILPCSALLMHPAAHPARSEHLNFRCTCICQACTSHWDVVLHARVM